MEIRIYNLEDRLVKFACLCLEVCEKLPDTKVVQNLIYQLSKSGTAPALLYGEAQTRINLRIILEKPICSQEPVLAAFKEVNELIAIFSTSIATAKRNLR